MKGSSLIAIAATLLIGYSVLEPGGPPPAAAAPAPDKCQMLSGTKLKNATVDAASAVVPGHVVNVVEGSPGLPAPVAFCRVQATLSPVAGSSIKVEVWLPDPAKWNRKLLGAGNGGFGGNLLVPSFQMRRGLQRGYASVGSDLGHSSNEQTDGRWALNAPEKIKDYGWRANHLAAEFAKQLISTYYEAPLSASYFHGCSDGGREALILAQRFPKDYDAIAAGAPASPWSRLSVAGAYFARELEAAGPQGALPRAKLQLLQAAALSKCDGLDGVKDGVIENPRACRFDPAALLCKKKPRPGAAGSDASCLEAPQVAVARKLYGGVPDAKGRLFFPGFAPGTEAETGTWDQWLTGKDPWIPKFATNMFRYMVYNNPDWKPADLDQTRDYEQIKMRVGKDLDADEVDLKGFFGNGGKLLLYHGWQDAAIPPESLINYYQRVVEANPKYADASVRLFMAPGMSHCMGGPGPSVFDAVGVLDDWRQNGVVPERIVAGKYKNDLFAYLGLSSERIRTRPLCPFPKIAHWDRKGSTDDAASFACRNPG